MKIDFDPKNFVPRFTLEEHDIKDARKVKAMMETEGWQILQKYLDVGREALIDSGKDGIRTRTKEGLSGYKWAILKGWDERGAIPERIVERAMEHLEEEKNKEVTYDE